MKIVVIEAIGLHLSYLGCYGNDWVATPNLDRLASEGVVFDWHIADQPHLQSTIPWHERSVATGRYALPPLDGNAAPRVLANAAAIGPRVLHCEELASFAADAGRALAADVPWLWIAGPSLLAPWKLDEELLDVYFDEDDVDEGLTPWIDPPLGLVKLNEAEVLQLQNSYAAAVTVFDAQLGALVGRLDLDDTLLIVTASAGLPLGEHGMIGAPRPWLHDELVHLPLVMRLPKSMETGLRIAASTQPVDLLPTILETLGAPSVHCHGRSLWPLIRGEVESIRPYAVSAMRVAGWENWLLRTPERALHVPIIQPDTELACRPQMFLKPEDRWEVNNLYQQQMETAEVLERTLRAFVEATRQPGPFVYPAIDERGSD